MNQTSKLHEWVNRLAALAQSGLTFDPGVYDRQRYEEVQQIAAEMATWPDGDVESVAEIFRDATGYATPKIVCRGAVIHEGRILMVRETIDGRWTIPGGWVDVGESPATAVEREVFEESGYQVEVTKLAALYDKLRHDHPPVPHHSYIVFFSCELLGGEPTPSIETSEIGWFAPDELPELSENRTTEAQILRMFEHHADPSLPTDFDPSLA